MLSDHQKHPARFSQQIFSVLVCFFLFFAALAPLPLRAQTLESGPEQVRLLEAYSSEGCSSCPPADHWLAQLEKQPGLWKIFVPVTFHVDYWDNLGWKDTLASPLFSERQHRYARIWRSKSVYTPGFVLDGKEWRTWRSETSVPALTSRKTGRLSLRPFNQKYYAVSFKPEKEFSAAPLRAHAALLAHSIRHDILQGENTGKTLTHHFAVIAYGEEPLHPEGDHFTALIEPRKNYPGKVQAAYAAAWVSHEITGEVLQAAGGKI